MKEHSEKIGSLWKRTSKAGATYLTGIVGGQRVVVFKVKEKRSDKSPDFLVYEDTKVPEKPEPKPKPEITNDDIPF